jgi:hypothetical protein
MEDGTASLCCPVRTRRVRILAAADAGGELELLVQTTAELVGCPACGALARAKDPRPSWVRDLPIGGRPVVLCWWKRVWCCPHPLCPARTWTEQHPAIAPRAGLTERARAWAFEQAGAVDAALSRVAATLGVAWRTVTRQVLGRGTALVDDPQRLADVTAVGGDAAAYLRASPTRPTTFATGIADLTPGHPARLLDLVEGRSGSVLAGWMCEQDTAWRARGSSGSCGTIWARPAPGSAGCCPPPAPATSRPTLNRCRRRRRTRSRSATTRDVGKAVPILSVGQASACGMTHARKGQLEQADHGRHPCFVRAVTGAGRREQGTTQVALLRRCPGHAGCRTDDNVPVCGWLALPRSRVAHRPLERIVGHLLPARLDTGEV